METFLKVNNLSVEYTGKRTIKALKEVSFDVRQSEILGIIGESGSGKTTLAYSIVNLLPGNTRIKGKIEFKGKDILSFSERELRILRGKEIGIIPQDPAASFNPVFTIGYQFEEFLKSKKACADKEERVLFMEELLSKVHLPDPRRILKSYPHQLSGGQLQRAMIALTIAVKPSLLIADEPSSSLDVTVESQLIHMFLNLREELGLTIIFITHNLGLIEVLCDRVVVLYRGEVKEAGDKKSVIVSPQDGYTKSLIDSFKAIAGETRNKKQETRNKKQETRNKIQTIINNQMNNIQTEKNIYLNIEYLNFSPKANPPKQNLLRWRRILFGYCILVIGYFSVTCISMRGRK